MGNQELCDSMALYADLYELTMGQAYWSCGMSDMEAVFHLFYRKNPFGNGYAIACGLEDAVRYLRNLTFSRDDIEYLSAMPGSDGRPLFSPDFLDHLRGFRFECDVDAVPEGTVVFPHEPLVRVSGPIIQAQLVETALLTVINFQTLVATKAARICQAAMGDPVMEFGARRAQGIDGALSATRAAYIGGCVGTSNVWAAKKLGLPPSAVKGTMAHSFIMSFASEVDSFNAYARALPNNCVFLVDTYGTLEGVRHAIEAAVELRKRGYDLAGIRLDSGDLAALSKKARAMLNEAGFRDARIMASNDLDERLIESLKRQDAAIAVWAVGTRLVTASDDPALGGVYKLSAIRRPGEEWQDRIKLSDQPIKVSNPGILQVRRYSNSDRFVADVIHDVRTDMSEGCAIIHPIDMTRQKRVPASAQFTDLLVPIFRKGELVYEQPSLDEIRRRREVQMHLTDPRIRRFDNPHEYSAWLEKSLYQKKTDLILQRRGVNEADFEVL